MMTRRNAVRLVSLLVWVLAGAAFALLRPGLSLASSDESGSDAVHAARAHASLLVNLSSTNADETLKQLKQQATGSWATQLDADPQAIARALKKASSRTEGRIDSVAVKRASGEEAAVLVAASALVSNAAGAKQATRTYYFVLALTRVDGAWRVASVESVS